MARFTGLTCACATESCSVCSGLQAVAPLNPLTYLVDALRGTMIAGGEAMHGLSADFAVMLAVFAIFTAFAARLYPELAR